MSFGGGLQILFNAGVSPHDACSIIRCTFPQATCDQVDWYYQHLMARQVPRPIPDQTTPKNPPKNLSNLPAELLSKITVFLSASEIKKLKVSSQYTLLNVNTNRVYSRIQLHLDSEKILFLTCGSELEESSREPSLNIRKTFSKRKRSRNDGKRGIPQQETRYDFVDDAVKALKTAIDRNEIKIKRFSITSGEANEKIEKYLSEKLQQTMAELRRMINVEEFNLDIKSSVPLKEFLRSLNPETLKIVNMFGSTAAIIDMKEIVTLPHWPYLMQFYAMDVSSLSLASVAHLERFNVRIQTITQEELAEYINSVLKDQVSIYHTIQIANGYPLADCLKQLEPYKQLGAEVGNGYLQRNGQKRVYFSLSRYSITFSSSRCFL